VPSLTLHVCVRTCMSENYM